MEYSVNELVQNIICSIESNENDILLKCDFSKRVIKFIRCTRVFSWNNTFNCWSCSDKNDYILDNIKTAFPELIFVDKRK